MSRMELLVESCRKAFASGQTRSFAFRVAQLESVLTMMEQCKTDIINALHADLRKSTFEASVYEVELVCAEVNYLLRNLKQCLKNDDLPINILGFLDRAYVQREPYGVVLILGTWNYPFILSLLPLAGAIAAGNFVLLKPSEMAASTAKTLSRIIPKYISSECCRVVEADVDGTKELLKNKFDYIFATGSTSMGRHVMAAAAPHLTPLTLELGGKSPIYIDDSSDFELAAKRIMWGKCVNLGQTCVAPDYIMCSKKVEQAFLKVALRVLNEWYGTHWKDSKDLTRIINERHFLRLRELIENTEGQIAFGGQMDQSSLWISPTIIVDVKGSDILMKDEIFGPILPILTVETPEDAIKEILARPKPLALYVFSKDNSVISTFLKRTSSGGVCVNDVIWQNGWEGLPFGGVGESGFGNYHGKYSIDTFSHKKAILHRGFSYLSEKLGEPRYPPYNLNKIKFLKFVVQYMHMFNLNFRGLVTHILAGCAGAFLLFLFLRS